MVSHERATMGASAPAAVAAGRSTAQPAEHPSPTAGAKRTRRAAVTVLLAYMALVVAGWLGNMPAGHEGIINVTVNPEAADGLIVTQLAPGGPIEQAGVRAGDVLVEIAGIPTIEHERTHAYLHERRVGEIVPVRFRHAIVGEDGVSYGPVEAAEVTLVSQLAIPSVVLDFVVSNSAGLLIVAVAALVALARPDEQAARLLLLFGGCFAFFIGLNTIHWTWTTLRLGNSSDYVAGLLATTGTIALLHLFLVFPAPDRRVARLTARCPVWLRRLGGALSPLYALGALAWVAVALGFLPMEEVFQVTLIVPLLAALLALLRNFWQPLGPRERAQMKWVAWGLGVFVVALVLGLIVPTTTGGRVRILPAPLLTAALGFFPLSIAIAVLRYRLWEINVVINRTLVYGALTAALAVVYFGSVVLLQQPFRVMTGQNSDIAVAVSTLAMAALFQPLRRRVRAVIDRSFYRRQYDAGRTVAAFSDHLRSEVDLNRLAGDLVEVVELDRAAELTSRCGCGRPSLRPGRSPTPRGDRPAAGWRGAGEPDDTPDRADAARRPCRLPGADRHLRWRLRRVPARPRPPTGGRRERGDGDPPGLVAGAGRLPGGVAGASGRTGPDLRGDRARHLLAEVGRSTGAANGRGPGELHHLRRAGAGGANHGARPGPPGRLAPGAGPLLRGLFLLRLPRRPAARRPGPGRCSPPGRSGWRRGWPCRGRSSTSSTRSTSPSGSSRR